MYVHVHVHVRGTSPVAATDGAKDSSRALPPGGPGRGPDCVHALSLSLTHTTSPLSYHHTPQSAAAHYRDLSPRGDLREAAAGLFEGLRWAEAVGGSSDDLVVLVVDMRSETPGACVRACMYVCIFACGVDFIQVFVTAPRAFVLNGCGLTKRGWSFLCFTKPATLT